MSTVWGRGTGDRPAIIRARSGQAQSPAPGSVARALDTDCEWYSGSGETETEQVIESETVEWLA